MNTLDKKSTVFLDELYKSLGGEVTQRAPNYTFNDWDKVLKFGEIVFKIEEKTRLGDYDDVLLELIEDIGTGDLGWIYQTKADRLIYCVYKDMGDEKPCAVYKFNIETLKHYLVENARELVRTCRVCETGYGLTLNIFLPLDVGIKIYP